MTLWHPSPPQGDTPEQELIIIGRPVIPRFNAPQGLEGAVTPPLEDAWIDNLGNEFVTDIGEVIIFSP